MCSFAVVSAATESVVELFPSREQAEAFVAEVERDEPGTAALVIVEPVELAMSSTNWRATDARLARKIAGEREASSVAGCESSGDDLPVGRFRGEVEGSVPTCGEVARHLAVCAEARVKGAIGLVASEGEPATADAGPIDSDDLPVRLDGDPEGEVSARGEIHHDLAVATKAGVKSAVGVQRASANLPPRPSATPPPGRKQRTDVPAKSYRSPAVGSANSTTANMSGSWPWTRTSERSSLR
jgi:hypothetical protein